MKVSAKKFRVSSAYWPKREFNPNSKQDLVEYQHFITTGGWKAGCPFLVEWPFITVPDTIQDKIIKSHISAIISKSKKELA